MVPTDATGFVTASKRRRKHVADLPARYDRQVVQLVSSPLSELQSRLDAVTETGGLIAVEVGAVRDVDVATLPAEEFGVALTGGVVASLVADTPSTGLIRHLADALGVDWAVVSTMVGIRAGRAGMPPLADRLRAVDLVVGQFRRPNPVADIISVLDGHATQTRIGELLGVSDTTLRSWLDGNSSPKPERMSRIDAVAEVCRLVRHHLDQDQWGEFMLTSHPKYGMAVIDALTRDPLMVRSDFRAVFGHPAPVAA